MARSLIVCHGGSWNGSIYEGGTSDYIHIPCKGISYKVLLSKIEIRIKEDMSTHTFDIDAMVKPHQGNTFRMKVTDEFEWSHLMDMMELPTLYVEACPKGVIQRADGNAHFQDVASLNTPCASVSNDTHASSNWVIEGIKEYDLTDDVDIYTGEESVTTMKVGLGSVFRCKDNMLSAIHSYHLRKSFEFRTAKSDPSRLVLKCKFKSSCAFLLRSRSTGKAWKIREFVAHTCAKDYRNCDDTKASARAISEFVSPSMTQDGFSVRPCDIQGQVLRDFGIRIKYYTALNGRNKALKAMYGDEEKSFQMLAKYLFMVEQFNPGSVVDLQTCNDSSFQYCFLCLAASIRAFRACRPVIVVDATHLKGKYKGVLFVATTKDANEQIVPLAFGIGDKEEAESWIWFLEHVKISFGTPDNLLIVSDQHSSIKNAVAFVFPGIAHGFCTYHIQGNLKTCKGWKAFGLDLFHYAAKAYRVQDFEEHMENMREACPAAHVRLGDIGHDTWAACKCPVRRYAYGTSNAVEVLNSRLKWARKLPVTALLEYCRNLVQAWFYQRRTKAGQRTHELSEYAENRLGLVIEKGNRYTVQPISNYAFNVLSGTDTNVVELNKKECSCKVFQMDLIPCSHAVAAMRFKNETPMAYVHAYYSTNTWREIYADEVMPVPNPSDWCIPIHIESRVVGTPTNPNQAGRPRTKRIPSLFPMPQVPNKDVGSTEVINEGTLIVAGETSEARKCSRCKQPSHYAPTCTAFILDPQDDVNPPVKRKRNPKRCDNCGFAGHTRPTCKDVPQSPSFV